MHPLSECKRLRGSLHPSRRSTSFVTLLVYSASPRAQVEAEQGFWPPELCAPADGPQKQPCRCTHTKLCTINTCSVPRPCHNKIPCESHSLWRRKFNWVSFALCSVSRQSWPPGEMWKWPTFVSQALLAPLLVLLTFLSHLGPLSHVYVLPALEVPPSSKDRSPTCWKTHPANGAIKRERITHQGTFYYSTSQSAVCKIYLTLKMSAELLRTSYPFLDQRHL